MVLSETPPLRDTPTPIMAGIYGRFESVPRLTPEEIRVIMKHGSFVDYYGKTWWYHDEDMLNGGEMTYVISPCDTNDKYSLRYYDCTGLIAVGTSRDSDEQISLLTHQDPLKFLATHSVGFREKMLRRLNELRRMTREGTVDVVAFGGRLDSFATFFRPEYKKYRDSIGMLDRLVSEVFGFSPTVIVGPNDSAHEGPTHVYFDTQGRRLHLVRPIQEMGATNLAFLPIDLKNQPYHRQSMTEHMHAWMSALQGKVRSVLAPTCGSSGRGGGVRPMMSVKNTSPTG